MSDFCLVPLTGRRDGQRVIVGHAKASPEDFDELSSYRWHLSPKGYACRGLARPGGRTTTVRMSRQILGLKIGDPRQADHINRDRLDNRRTNLRIVTHQQNHQNRPSDRGSASPFRGVTRDGEWWRASVFLNGRRVNLGRFADEQEAAQAAAAFRAEHMPFSADALLLSSSTPQGVAP